RALAAQVDGVADGRHGPDRHLHPEKQYEYGGEPTLEARREAQVAGAEPDGEPEEEQPVGMFDQRRRQIERQVTTLSVLTVPPAQRADEAADERQHGEGDEEDRECDRPFAELVTQELGMPQLAPARHRPSLRGRTLPG